MNINRIRRWHRTAMAEADLADLARRRGDDWAMRAHSSFAYEVEKTLVMDPMVVVGDTAGRSVLMESAAWLGLEAGRARDVGAMVGRILEDPNATVLHDAANRLRDLADEKISPIQAKSMAYRSDAYLEDGAWHARPDLRGTRHHIAFRALVADLPEATRRFLVDGTRWLIDPPLTPAELDAHCERLIVSAGIAKGRDGLESEATYLAECQRLEDHRKAIAAEFEARDDRHAYADFGRHGISDGVTAKLDCDIVDEPRSAAP